MNARQHIRLLLKGFMMTLLVISFAAISSCEKGDEPPPLPEPQPAKYTIKGQVINQQTNTPISGVLVTMGSLTQTTTATGSFEFANLTEAGKYTLVFKKEGFFDATYSLEFQAAAPNHTISYTISVSMVPYVPGVTPINFATGGTVSVTGAVPAELTIPAGTTVTDKNGQPVTGTVNITAVANPDIIAGTSNNPGIAVMRFEPSGLQFSNPLPLALNNPLSTYRFTSVQLEYFNETTNLWEVKPQPVTYNTATNKYETVINHFSIYKISHTVAMSYLGSTEENVNVIDNLIENKTLTPKTITSISIKRKSGYKYETPLETLITQAGVSGSDVSALAAMIEEVIKPYVGNASPVAELVLTDEAVSVSRVIQPNYKLVTSGRQAIDRNSFTVSITGPGGEVSITAVVQSAGAVSLFFQDSLIDDHGHGGGGGGS